MRGLSFLPGPDDHRLDASAERDAMIARFEADLAREGG